MYAGRYCSVPRAGSDSNGNYECLEHDLHKELWELAHKNKKSVDGSDAALLPSARSLHQAVETRSRARSSFLVT